MSVRERLRTLVVDTAGRAATALGPAAAASSVLIGWRVPILLYHQVAESGTAYGLRVSPQMFETQMAWLASEGYRVVPLDDLLAARQRGYIAPKSVAITFDDGHRGVMLHAYPVLKRFGFHATLFLATGSMDGDEFPWTRPLVGKDRDPDEYRPLRWAEVRALDRAVIGLGSHSVSHPHLAQLSADAMRREMTESRRRIEEETGVNVRWFSYPGGIARYGDHSDETRRALVALGYAGGLVSEIGRNSVSADPFRLRRLSIEAPDTLGSFRAKVTGAYSFVRALQWGAQLVFADPSNY
jgi:peptidoglycan/xylan/chitin deacetylase (PgdA/CDA1 family)